jgi:NTE family protein
MREPGSSTRGSLGAGRPTSRRRELLRRLLAMAGGLGLGAARAGDESAPVAAGAPRPRRKLALALGSGGAHGIAHLGVMRAFESRGLRPDLIVGTSAGAIVGALWAAGLDAARVEREGARFGLFDAMRPAWPTLGLASNDGLQSTLRELLPARPIEDFPIAFAAVATDLADGRRVLIDRGDAPSAVAASACMPVIFRPVEREGRRLVDGALVEPVPVRSARELGGTRVVAVDIAFRPADEPVTHALGAAFQMVHILVNALIDEQIGEADVPVRLQLHPLMRGRPDYEGILIDAGQRAVEAAWPRIVG